MEKDTNTFLMAPFLEESLDKESSMEEEYMSGRMGKFMMDNGKMGTRLAAECGQIWKEKVIWVNGKTIKLKVLAFSLWKMVQDTKENLKILWNME